MYKEKLEAKLKRIFQVERVTFDLPSDQYEQDRLFIEVAETIGNVSDRKAAYRVTGACYIFGKIDKHPHGFFARKIGSARPADLDGLFFSAETTPVNSPARVLDLIESRIAFTFLFKAEIDPVKGQLTSVEGLSNG